MPKGKIIFLGRMTTRVIGVLKFGLDEILKVRFGTFFVECSFNFLVLTACCDRHLNKPSCHTVEHMVVDSAQQPAMSFEI